MKLQIDPAFSPKMRSAFVTFTRSAPSAIRDVTGRSLPDRMTIHAMTPAEVASEMRAPEGGGAGYYDPETGRLAINPDLDTWRSVEVLCEELIHAVRPEWSESRVRGSAVPAVLRGTLGRKRLRRKVGP